MGGLHQGPGVALFPQVDLKPEVHLGCRGPEEASVLHHQAQVGVALFALIPTGVEGALAPFPPLRLLPLIEREVAPFEAGQVCKKFPPPEDHLAGVLPQLPLGGEEGLGLQEGVICVAGVEAEEGAEGAAFPLQCLAIFAFQQTVVPVAHRRGEAAHEGKIRATPVTQGGHVVPVVGEEEEGFQAGVGLGFSFLSPLHVWTSWEHCRGSSLLLGADGGL